MAPTGDPARRGPGDGGRSLAGTPRWLLGLLLVSLGVNLGIAGVAAGRWMRDMGEDPSLGRFERRMLDMVPEDRRAEARAILTENADADRAAFLERLMRTTETVADAMRAQPFDAEALRAALSARLDVFRERFDARHDRTVALVAALPPEDRRRMAEALTERTRSRIAERAAR